MASGDSGDVHCADPQLRCGFGSPVMDAGGGSSLLVDHLLQAGDTDLTVLDISQGGACGRAERLSLSSDAALASLREARCARGESCQ